MSEIAKRGNLALVEQGGAAVLSVAEAAGRTYNIPLSPADLRWLLTAGIPAALQAVGGVPPLRRPPEAPE